MKWENIIKRKMADTNITIFNQEVIDILSNRNHLSAAEIYDNLSTNNAFFSNTLIIFLKYY